MEKFSFSIATPSVIHLLILAALRSLFPFEDTSFVCLGQLSHSALLKMAVEDHRQSIRLGGSSTRHQRQETVSISKVAFIGHGARVDSFICPPTPLLLLSDFISRHYKLDICGVLGVFRCDRGHSDRVREHFTLFLVEQDTP